MALRLSIIAAEEADRRQLEALLLASGRAALAGAPLPLPAPFAANEGQVRAIQAQMPDAVLLRLPGEAPGREAALGLIAWLKEQMPSLGALIVAGPMDQPLLIVEAMRAGATEYLEAPVREAALEQALQRVQAAHRQGASPGRGKLLAVLGARGGCGTTTIATNLAVAMQTQRRLSEGNVVLLDAAPLGHAALQLNLKPQYTLLDLLQQAQRLDAAMLGDFLQHHATGLTVLAGAPAPLPLRSEEEHAAWVEMLLQCAPVVMVDLSARLDVLTRVVVERADRILFVTQTDMVSLWSAAKVRQYLDPSFRLQFELVLNRYNATPEVDLAGLEAVTRATVLWKLPNAHQLVTDAIEHGQPPAVKGDTELGRSFVDLAGSLLGRQEKKKPRGWLTLLRAREAEG